MSLPLNIEANNPPTGDGEPRGIIYSIRQKVGEKNITSFVIPTENRKSSGTTYNIDTLVKWNGDWSSASSIDAYFQLEFKDAYVFPTYYSLKGRKNFKYAKEWYLYGFNENEEKMTVISENTSVGSTFCSGVNPCPSDDWGTFQIINDTKPFKFFRLAIKTPSNTAEPFNAVRGIEIFGVYISAKSLLNKKKKITCHAPCHYRSHVLGYSLLILLTTRITT